MNNGIYKFYWDCKRQGEVNGVFVAEKKTLNKAMGMRVHFGEILGKHSEVYGTLDPEDITLVTEDPEVIKLFEAHKLHSGYNPLNYLRNEDGEEVYLK